MSTPLQEAIYRLNKQHGFIKQLKEKEDDGVLDDDVAKLQLASMEGRKKQTADLLLDEKG
ncbi:MAG: hypothetical protein WDZ94_00435 [Patescibacteria group bacterium]